MTKILKLALTLGVLASSGQLVNATVIPNAYGYASVINGLDHNTGFSVSSPVSLSGDCTGTGDCNGLSNNHTIVGAYSMSFGLTPTPYVSVSCTGDCGRVNDPNYGNYGFIDYYFYITGPADVLVPVVMAGSMELSAGGVLGSSLGVAYANGFSKVERSCTANVSGSDCGTFNFSQTAMLSTNHAILAEVFASAVSGGLSYGIPGGGYASAWVDPYFSIDPTWALDHPGYSIIVSDGVGNSPPQSNAVPEPGTIALVGLALVGMGGLRRRKA